MWFEPGTRNASLMPHFVAVRSGQPAHVQGWQDVQERMVERQVNHREYSPLEAKDIMLTAKKSSFPFMPIIAAMVERKYIPITVRGMQKKVNNAKRAEQNGAPFSVSTVSGWNASGRHR